MAVMEMAVMGMGMVNVCVLIQSANTTKQQKQSSSDDCRGRCQHQKRIFCIRSYLRFPGKVEHAELDRVRIRGLESRQKERGGEEEGCIFCCRRCQDQSLSQSQSVPLLLKCCSSKRTTEFQDPFETILKHAFEELLPSPN